MTRHDPITGQLVHKVKLATGAGAAPPYAVLQIIGFDSNSRLMIVQQPNTDSAWPLMVNGSGEIPEGGEGQAVNEYPTRILYHAADGTPTLTDPPQTWGSGNGSWELRLTKFGFSALGGVDGGSAVFMRAAVTNVACVSGSLHLDWGS